MMWLIFTNQVLSNISQKSTSFLLFHWISDICFLLKFLKHQYSSEKIFLLNLFYFILLFLSQFILVQQWKLFSQLNVRSQWFCFRSLCRIDGFGVHVNLYAFADLEAIWRLSDSSDLSSLFHDFLRLIDAIRSGGE
jgi:hypothetical protein